ncbi:hypothetical protein APTSU1_000007700 [Apodemus speciosus]|uniref:Uncharacterized protein n=1 Tax=Apodemus speciosus TaxID=105296 RepID=A0ABQ0ECS5_APOSI
MVRTWVRTPTSRTPSSSVSQAPAEAARVERVEERLDYVFHSGISKQPTNNQFFLVLSMPG